MYISSRVNRPLRPLVTLEEPHRAVIGYNAVINQSINHTGCPKSHCRQLAVCWSSSRPPRTAPREVGPRVRVAGLPPGPRLGFQVYPRGIPKVRVNGERWGVRTRVRARDPASQSSSPPRRPSPRRHRQLAHAPLLLSSPTAPPAAPRGGHVSGRARHTPPHPQVPRPQAP